METIKTDLGSVFVLGVSEIDAQAQSLGLPIFDPQYWNGAVDRTNDRIEQRLKRDLVEALRFGAFSYLLEVARAWQNGGELAQQCAVEVADAFLKCNRLSTEDVLTRTHLQHFANVIQTNEYDWEGLLIAYLDPDAAQMDRLRQNLKLTPAERLRRHQKLIPLLKKSRRVQT